MNKNIGKNLKKIICNGLKNGRGKEGKNDYNFKKEQEELIHLFFKIFGTFEEKETNYSKEEEIIFGKLNNKTKQKILDFIKNPNTLDEETKEEVKKIGKQIFYLLDSVSKKIPDKNISEYIESEMKNSGQALERFILYFITKFCKKDNTIIVRKSKREYEPKKIDFRTEYKDLEGNYILFANQLTASGYGKFFEKKIRDMYYLRESIDNNNFKKFREENIPDLPILMSVNSSIGALVGITIKKHKNPFFKAYKKIGRKSLEDNFSKDVKKQFETIGKLYPYGIKLFLKTIKEIDLNKNFKKEEEKESINILIEYNLENKKYIIIFYKKTPDNSKYKIFSLEFFITDKFLKKYLAKN